MKQRLTYVVKDPDTFSPDQLSVTGSSLGLKNVDAAKEHRITLGLGELPNELSEIFKQWHETHIRWVSPKQFALTPPFTSRVSPGLHILFTPLESTPSEALSDQLRLFNVQKKCSGTNETAIKLPILSERFSMSASSQYYTYLESVAHFMQTVIPKLKLQTLESLMNGYKDVSSLSYLDIDYDTISRAVVLNFGWADSPSNKGWSETVYQYPKDSTVEIGVLSHEANSDPEDIQFGGFLTVLGEDASPKATRFQTPTRHYPLLSSSTSSTSGPKPHDLTYTTSFSRPTGLHPTLILTFPTAHLTPPEPTCKLHTHLTLPSYLFIDKYQFTDPLFLSSKHLRSLRSLAGATDLEAPNWVIQQWGSAALFELAFPSPSPSSSASPPPQWNISIPLHLRYLPTSPTSHTTLPLPWPIVFWACRSESGPKMAANPFDRQNLGYDGLFGPKTRFMGVQPSSERGELVEWIDVPVLDTRKAGWVEVGTVGVVVLSFLGLCWVLFGRIGEKERDGERKEGKKTQ